MAGKAKVWLPRLTLLLSVLFLTGGCRTPPPSYGVSMPAVRAMLLEYHWFDDQPTGIAISSQVRIFVSFPQWGKDPLYSVAEIYPDGSLQPYPDLSWNRRGKPGDPQLKEQFVCVQSIFVDNDDNLWILDPASPAFKGVVKGAAKLVKVNLAEDKVEQVIQFDEHTALPDSYLNDVRIDTDKELAYITDSGTGAIIVTDLSDGTSRRLLDGHYSTRAEPGFVPVVDGRPLLGEGGLPPQIHADGIALDTKGDFLYYHALTARWLYRISTDYLRDPLYTPEQVAGKVEKVIETGLVDGMAMDDEDNLYLTVPEEKGIKRLNRDGKKLVTIVQNEQVQWPDSISLSPDNLLYFTDSQINRMPRFNAGNDKRLLPYRLYKILLPLL